MPVGHDNLTPELQARFGPSIGQTFYMIDPNYRTAAQGWAQSDHTGPLDLYTQRTKTYYGPGVGQAAGSYATDAAAIQAANDAMVDFRGDILYFTPGNYSVATAVTVNVPYARWLGQAYKSPKYGCPLPVRNTTITCAVTNALTMGTANGHDGMELAYLRFIPITADESILFSAAGDGIYWHDFLLDFHGVAESDATNPIAVTADGGYNFSQFDQFTAFCDEAMGPCFDVAGDIRQTAYSNFYLAFDEVGAAWVTPLLDIAAGGNASDAISIGPGLVNCGAGTGSTVFTQLVALVEMDATLSIGLYEIRAIGAQPAATAFVSGTAGDVTFCENYMITNGGALITS